MSGDERHECDDGLCLDGDCGCTVDVVRGERAVDDEVGGAVDLQRLRSIRWHVVDDSTVDFATATVEVLRAGADGRVRDGLVRGLVAVGDRSRVVVDVPATSWPETVWVEPRTCCHSYTRTERRRSSA